MKLVELFENVILEVNNTRNNNCKITCENAKPNQSHSSNKIKRQEDNADR